MRPSPYTSDVTTVRVLVFVEPVSNRYSQFELTEEQYIDLLNYLEKNCPHVDDAFMLPLKEAEITLPDTPAHL